MVWFPIGVKLAEVAFAAGIDLPIVGRLTMYVP